MQEGGFTAGAFLVAISAHKVDALEVFGTGVDNTLPKGARGVDLERGERLEWVELVVAALNGKILPRRVRILDDAAELVDGVETVATMQSRCRVTATDA